MLEDFAFEHLLPGDVDVVGRLVHEVEVGLAEAEAEEREAGTLAEAQGRDRTRLLFDREAGGGEERLGALIALAVADDEFERRSLHRQLRHLLVGGAELERSRDANAFDLLALHGTSDRLHELRLASAVAAEQHDAVALLRRDTDDHYWRRVLVYCAQHNLQAVLDEYAHYLVDAEGLGARPAEERAIGVARAMAQALAIRPSQIDVDDVHVDGEALAISKFQMRGRFAMRLADYKDEDGAVARLGGVRDAFNSPFRPFVLATTSVGQEGLDFHPYCYRVYHWNLPGNPVDLEQREGRVHRFKGHAVRLNLAERQATVVRGRGQAPDDPWKLMFECARSEAAVDTDLIPYWIYEGSVRVERRVPMLPFSREVTRLAWLKRSLTVYRLAFGQPRQDDLLDYLQTLAGDGMDSNLLADLQIRLEPEVFDRSA